MVQATPDADRSWVDRLPPRLQLYARLARFDRPVGIWLLWWPCAFGWAIGGDDALSQWSLLIWFAVGATAMRAAGCVYNDIVDRDLDARVARTAARPVASGAISVRAAWAFLCALSLFGLLALLQLPREARLIALASLLLVGAYPYMKRITWWPQAWLGLTFNWGVPVAWATVLPFPAEWPAMAALYVACIFWTLGYDSLYAAQDIEDDALAGIKSSARALGDRLQPGVAVFYSATLVFLGLACWLVRGDPLVLAALLPLGIHFAWQVSKARQPDVPTALLLFKSNVRSGWLILLPLLVASV